MKVAIIGAWSFSSFILWFAFIVSEKKKVLQKNLDLSCFVHRTFNGHLRSMD